MDGIFRRTASSHHSGGADSNEVETGGSGTTRRGAGAGAGRAHGGQATWQLRMPCPRASTASLLFLLLLVVAIIFINMYMTVLHKLAQQEQEALQYIVELDRLSRKVREIDQRFHYLSKECNLKDGEEVIAELTQRAMETEEALKTTRENLWDLKLKHDARLQEYGNAIEDIDHLKRKLAIKDSEVIQCRRSSTTDPDASSTSSLSTHPPGFHWVHTCTVCSTVGHLQDLHPSQRPPLRSDHHGDWQSSYLMPYITRIVSASSMLGKRPIRFLCAWRAHPSADRIQRGRYLPAIIICPTRSTETCGSTPTSSTEATPRWTRRRWRRYAITLTRFRTHLSWVIL